MATRILTWNLQGSARPDLVRVADVLRELRPDVVALQEVQRRQARDVARALGWHATWRVKHRPVVVAAEGLAVLTPLPPKSVVTEVLAHRWRWWSWRRRIALAVDVETPDGGLRVVDVHLGAHVADEERRRQAAATVALLSGRVGVVAGDLNAHPVEDALVPFRSHGMLDAWEVCHPDRPGATNWAPGPRTEPPTQRLDYVFCDPDLDVTGADLAVGEDAVALGPLSDHLPLTVTVDRR